MSLLVTADYLLCHYTWRQTTFHVTTRDGRRPVMSLLATADDLTCHSSWRQTACHVSSQDDRRPMMPHYLGRQPDSGLVWCQSPTRSRVCCQRAMSAPITCLAAVKWASLTPGFGCPLDSSSRLARPRHHRHSRVRGRGYGVVVRRPIRAMRRGV